MSKWLSLLCVSVVVWPTWASCCFAAEMADSPADAKIEAALRSPTTLEFLETPLSDVVEYLKDLHKIEILLDLKSLKDVGASPDTPITRDLRGVSLRSALRLMLGELDLTCTVNRGVLLITTPETAAKQVFTRHHAIEDVLRPNVSPEGAKARGDALIRFVSAAYEPQAWQPRGGRGSLALDPPEAPNSLVVEQSADIQEQIVKFLDQLRGVAREMEMPASVPPKSRFGNSAASPRILAALESPTDLEFMETPLSDVIQYLKDFHKIEIQLDCKELHDVGVSSDLPVTLKLKGAPLRTALRVILHNRNLTYLIDNEVLLITRQERADETWTTEVYMVADLLGQDAAHATKMAAEDLLRVIRRSVEPASWREANGHGVIVATEAGVLDVLLVRQTYAAHEQILELLDSLSKLGSLASVQPRPAPGEPLGYTDAKRQVIRALAAPVSVNVEMKRSPFSDEIDFSDVIEPLSQAAGIRILCDTVVLADRKIDSDAKVSGKWEKEPLKNVLDRLLGRLRLGYVVEDGLLWITTAEKAQQLSRIEVYPIGVGRADLSEADLNELAQRILGAVSPQSWHKAGGEGMITPIRVGSQWALVIRQKAPVHEELRRWLASPGPK